MGLARSRKQCCGQAFYALPFFAFSALYFAHRTFVAFEIFALAAADMTCFFTAVTSRVAL
jgi:hypothetical protein